MIVVEGNTLLSKEEDKSKTPFQPDLEARGFELIARRLFSLRQPVSRNMGYIRIGLISCSVIALLLIKM
jgi:hypothetical protein